MSKCRLGSGAGNNQYGKAHRRKFAFAYQGTYWGNHHGGETVAALVASRLQNSIRATADASAADVFFIPFSTRNSCVLEDAVKHWRDKCGVDFISGRNTTRLWTWLLAQPSFKNSNGSDHVLIIEPPKPHMAQVLISICSAYTVQPAMSLHSLCRGVWCGTATCVAIVVCPYAFSVAHSVQTGGNAHAALHLAECVTL